MGEETNWLDDDQQRTWRAFIIGSQLLLDRLDRDLRLEHGVSLAEYEILVRLDESPGNRMRMALLADALCHSRSRVTHTVARMERTGLLERSAAADDGRGVEALLCTAGRDLLSRAAITHVDGVRRHLVDVTAPTDFEALGRVMNEVADRLLTGKPLVADLRQTR